MEISLPLETTNFSPSCDEEWPPISRGKACEERLEKETYKISKGGRGDEQ
jgi:hypothetical protein